MRELVKQLTKIIDLFSIATHNAEKPNLILKLLDTLKHCRLSPMDFRTERLQTLANGLRDISVPALYADEDHEYVTTSLA